LHSVLHLKLEEIDSAEKRSEYTVSVVGCDKKGILLANAFADAGFKVVCSDADPSVMKKISRGKTPFSQPSIEGKLKSHITKGRISATNDLKKTIPQSDIIILTVSPTFDAKNKMDYSPVINVCKQIGAALKQGTLIMYSGIAGFGFTEGTIKETLENTSALKAGKDFGLAYHPALLVEATDNVNLKVAASDQTSLNAATTILNTLSKNVKTTNQVKVAEIAALFTIAKQDANRALANELAIFCDKAGIDYFEALQFLDFDTSGFLPIAVEEENRYEVYLLLDTAENVNGKLRLSTLARQINEDMVKHAVNLTQEGLRNCGKSLRRARVAIIGSDNTPSDTSAFVRMLKMKGAKINIYDPKANREQSNLRAVKTKLSDAIEGTDCIVILPMQEQLHRLNLKKLKVLMRKPSVIVDLTGTLEPKKVATEGFLYCGLGRGTGTR
jgi:UDP-N-acetyl-D-mannosaminuronic acid dehydrogenase